MLEDRVLRLVLATAVLFACSSADASEKQVKDSQPTANRRDPLESLPRPSSPILAVPNDSQLAFYYDAVGVQIYTCEATTTGHAWIFKAPEASLFDRPSHVVLEHYAGPTWEAVSDHSKVVARKIAEFSPHTDAIPELLLQVTSHVGKGALAEVTYIQRLHTAGGVAPTIACDPGRVGSTVRVDYTATYTFSRLKPRRK